MRILCLADRHPCSSMFIRGFNRIVSTKPAPQLHRTMNSMKNPIAHFLLLAFVAFNLRAQEASPTETLADLQSRLAAVATHPRFAAAMLGVKVESLDTGKIIFEHDANKL